MVLDEGHKIRNPDAGESKSSANSPAVVPIVPRRWCFAIDLAREIKCISSAHGTKCTGMLVFWNRSGVAAARVQRLTER